MAEQPYFDIERGEAVVPWRVAFPRWAAYAVRRRVLGADHAGAQRLPSGRSRISQSSRSA